ncbi:MAG: CHRD domain-containing protein [Nitrososphaeraceae archaeon]
MINKGIEHHFKVSVLITLAIASVGLVFQANIYGQEGSNATASNATASNATASNATASQTQIQAVFLGDLKPRTGSNASGVAGFEFLGGDTMSYTINATGTSNISNIWLSQSTGGRFTDLVQIHSATRDGLINAPINGTVASGNLTAADFTGAPLQGKSISDLAKMMVDGQVFVRISTSDFPSGEIIGKLAVI